MSGADYASHVSDRRDEAEFAEVDGLGVAAVVLYGRDPPEQAARAAEEPRSFIARTSWFARWAGWRRG